MRNRTFAVFLVPALLANQIFAQAHPELEALDGRIKQHFEKALPEWKYERVEPLSNSKDVLVQFWSGQNSKVKVSVLLHPSVEAARAVFESHKKYSLNKEVLNDLGDEAVSSDLGPPVAFRKGKYTFYISADVDFGAELYARGFSESEIFKREASERRRLSRELARHVAAALDAP